MGRVGVRKQERVMGAGGFSDHLEIRADMPQFVDTPAVPGGQLHSSRAVRYVESVAQREVQHGLPELVVLAFQTLTV